MMALHKPLLSEENKLLSSQGNQGLICYKWVLFMLVINQYVATQKIVHPAISHSVSK